MDENKKFLHYNGQRIAYCHYGNTAAPAIVLLMGLGLPGQAWPMTLLSYLLQEGFQIIIPDNRDCGDSFRFPAEKAVTEKEVGKAIMRALAFMPVSGNYALEDMALDVEKLLNELQIRRAHVVGISMGGMIAQVLATQCPNRVASIVTIASASGNPKTGLGNLKAIQALIARPKERTPEAVRAYFENVFYTLAGSDYKPEVGEMRFLLNAVDRIHYDAEGAYRQLLAILMSGNRAKQLRRLHVPTLVIHGTDDPLLPFEAGKELADLIPGARLESINGMGHQLPEKLMPRIGKLIARHFHANPA